MMKATELMVGDWIADKADIANIKYVHELQHALRLCGVEKEVVI